MLKILDRYIIKKFLTTFFFMLGVIMILAMVFDLSDRLGDFLENEAPFYDIVFIYYFNFILLYGNMFSFMIIFISVIWFTAKMAQDTEIIPMWNSGKPFSRFIRPYMIASTILVIISLIINHSILPRSNNERLKFEESFYRDGLNVNNYNAEYPGNQLVQFGSYLSEENYLNNFVLQRFDDKDSLIYFLSSRTATNEAGTNKWKLTDYYERYVGFPSDRLNEGPLKDTTFIFTIEEMATRNSIATAMSTPELIDFIKSEKAKGSGDVPLYKLELHQRTSNPFATYILTIIGITVSSRKKRGGIGINIAIGLVIVLIYIFAMKITAVAAENVGFPAALAAWVPNMLFAIVAIFMYRTAQK